MPPVSVPPDSTFEYTSSLNVTQSLNEESVSTNEFTLDHIDSEMAQKLTLDDDSQNKVLLISRGMFNSFFSRKRTLTKPHLLYRPNEQYATIMLLSVLCINCYYL